MKMNAMNASVNDRLKIKNQLQITLLLRLAFVIVTCMKCDDYEYTRICLRPRSLVTDLSMAWKRCLVVAHAPFRTAFTLHEGQADRQQASKQGK